MTFIRKAIAALMSTIIFIQPLSVLASENTADNRISNNELLITDLSSKINDYDQNQLPRRIIVKYKKSSDREDVINSVTKKQDEELLMYSSSRLNSSIHTFSYSDSYNENEELSRSKITDVIDVIEVKETNEDIIDALKTNDKVEYIIEDIVVKLSQTDPYYNLQWGLDNNGESIESKNYNRGEDLNITPLWEATKGAQSNKAPIVGIIDTGIDINHEDLVDNIYVNNKEVVGNGIDDDGNGYIDDYQGYDFINKDNQVYDDIIIDEHGTHVAGIIGASKNDVGIVGTSPNTKILPLKVFNGQYAYTTDIIKAIKYAEAMGASIINCSFGSYQENPLLYETILESDMLFIASAGNMNSKKVSYPAAYPLPNIISVGSMNIDGLKEKTSNYGEQVDTWAPGGKIFSTVPDNKYAYKSGTSMAAAYITGLASLLMEAGYDTNRYTLRKAIISGSKSEQIVDAEKVYDKLTNAANTTTSSVIEFIEPLEPLLTSSQVIDITTSQVFELQSSTPVLENPFKYDKYNAQVYSSNIAENVSTKTGSVTLGTNLITLKGKNGLDLDISIGYDSSKANLYEEDIEENVGYTYSRYQFYFNSSEQITSQNNRIGPSRLQDLSQMYTVRISPFDSYREAVRDYYFYRTLWVNAGYNNNPITSVTLPYKVAKVMSFGDITANYDACKNVVNTSTYMEQRNNLGAGWEFKFSSIEVDDSNYILHLSDGRVFPLEFYGSEGRLKDYKLKDLKLEKDEQTFSSATRKSAYVLTYKNGYKEYFDVSGNLLGQVDRFGNAIKFTYIEVNGNTRINKIIDSLGREINFSYTESNGTKTLRITYGDREISLLSTSVGGHRENDYTLDRITDEEGRNTRFTYNISNVPFNFFSQESSQVPNNTNTFANLTNVQYPTGGSTEYTYEKVGANLGSIGYKEYYRLSTRKDIESNKDYNLKTYTYSTNNYTGYPEHKKPYELPTEFNYYTTTTAGNGYRIKNIYNNNHLNTKTEFIGNGDVRKYKESYYNNNDQVITSVSIVEQGSQSNKVINRYQFDDYNNLLASWDAQTEYTINNSDIGKYVPANDEHKITYSYDTTYNKLLNKTYKQDSNTKIIEEYSLTPDKKNRSGFQLYKQIGSQQKAKVNEITYAYYPDGNLRYVDKGEGRKVEYTYDRGAYIKTESVKNVVDADGELIQPISTSLNQGVITDYNNAGEIRKTYQYDSYGNVITEFDGEGNRTDYEYDKLDRITKLGSYLENQQKDLVLWTYNDDSNTVVATKENGQKVKIVYDGLGRELEFYEQQDYTGSVRWVRRSQNLYNNLSQILWTKDALGQKTSYQYDEEGRVTKTTNPDGTFSSVVYDDISNKKILGSEDGATVSQFYNDMGQVNKVERANVNNQIYTTRYLYDYLGNKISINDPRGNSTYYKYDIKGQLEAVTDPLGKVTTHQYDQVGNNVSTVIDGQKMISKEYDAANRLVASINPLDQSEKYYYDKNTNMSKSIDAKGIEALYKYDNRGRLLNLTKGTQKVDFTYDATGNVRSRKDNTGETRFTYYINGLLKSEIKPDGKSTDYKYDKLGRATEVKDYFGKVTEYTYDARSRLKTVKFNDRTTTYDYYSDGALKQIGYASGITVNYAYDELNRLTSVNNKNNVGQSIASYAYTYDEIGNQLTKTDQLGTTNYSYDALNRISTEVTPNGTSTSYSYDGRSNIKQMVITGQGAKTEDYLYNKNNQLLTKTIINNQSKEIYNYTYDKNGNMTFRQKELVLPRSQENTSEIKYSIIGYDKDPDLKETAAYTYDEFNQLTSYADYSGTFVKYSYNGTGLRETKTVDGNTTKYYTRGGLVSNETVNGELSATNVIGLNIFGRVDEKLEQQADFLYNGHNDVVGITDASNGTILANYDYGIFGESLKSSEGNFNNPIRYANEYLDEKTGMYYLRARYYNPVDRRFINEDTFTGKANEPRTLNLYVYCGNNPINYSDPSGNFWETVFDVISLGQSAYTMYKEPSWINAGLLLWDVLALLPGVPGSYIGKGIKGIKGLGKADELVLAGAYGEKIIDGTADLLKHAENVADGAGDIAKYGNKVAGNTSDLVLKGTKYSAEYAQKLKDMHKVFMSKGYEIGEHGLNRIFGRIRQGKIKSVDQVFDVLKNGTKYNDPVKGGTVLFKDGVSIHISPDGFIKSVIGKAKVKDTWELFK